jgi:hypothetical protein
MNAHLLRANDVDLFSLSMCCAGYLHRYSVMLRYNLPLRVKSRKEECIRPIHKCMSVLRCNRSTRFMDHISGIVQEA